MKRFLGVGLLLIAALPASAQTASVFVKGNGPQCWLDVRQIVHQRGKEVEEDICVFREVQDPIIIKSSATTNQRTTLILITGDLQLSNDI